MRATRIWSAATMLILLVTLRLPGDDAKESLPSDLLTYKVGYKDLQLKIEERGTLDAINRNDIKCEMRPVNFSNAKIKWIVDNGASAKKGDLLIEYDDAELREHMADKKVSVDNVISAAETAENELKLAQANNTKGIEESLEAGRQELKDFDGAGADAQRWDVKNRLAVADADVVLWRDYVARAERDLKDGKTSEEVVKADRVKMKAAEAEVEKIKAELAGLAKSLIEQRKRLERAVEQTQETLEQSRLTFEKSFRTAKANLSVTRAIRDHAHEQYKELQDQLKKCKVYAERSGLVYHVLPEGKSPGVSADIAAGDRVRFGQKLLYIPDLSRMLVKLRISEEYLRHIKLGLPAKVRVTAVPEKWLGGHVRSVGKVARSSGEVGKKAFEVEVEMDNSVDGLVLKPGLSASVIIHTEAKAAHVLAVPAAAVLPPTEKGNHSRCLVRKPGGYEEREIVLGLSVGRWLEVKSGLKEGEEIITDGRVLESLP